MIECFCVDGAILLFAVALVVLDEPVEECADVLVLEVVVDHLVLVGDLVDGLVERLILETVDHEEVVAELEADGNDQDDYGNTDEPEVDCPVVDGVVDDNGEDEDKHIPEPEGRLDIQDLGVVEVEVVGVFVVLHEAVQGEDKHDHHREDSEISPEESVSEDSANLEE